MANPATPSDRDSDSFSLWMALVAFSSWGLVPIFWKQLKEVSALEILGHRILWFWVFTTLLLWIWHKRRPRASEIPRSFRGPLAWGACLVVSNWGVYIWAVNAGHIVDASLGYFMNPFVNIALGVWLLKETLSRWQRWALVLALAGVLLITWDAGTFPWIGLFLASTFGWYGWIKKKVPLGTMQTNQFESLVTLPMGIVLLLLAAPLTAYFGFRAYPSAFSQLAESPHLGVLLFASGAVTAIPLLCFSSAARGLTMTALGFFQFLSPSLQFFVGWQLYQEPVSQLKMLGFALIWSALFILLFQGWRKVRALSVR